MKVLALAVESTCDAHRKYFRFLGYYDNKKAALEIRESPFVFRIKS